MARKLTDRQKRFVDEYLVDLNASQAAVRAGYKGDPDTVGPRLLVNVGVKREIDAAITKRSRRTEITADKVLERLWSIATADPNDLVQYRRNCCRYCYGEGHQYQWTEGEYLQAQAEARRSGNPEPELQGGFGYLASREPCPECPECAGEGKGRIHVEDTRRVKGPGRLLYAGVKQGKDGLELKLVDQLAALKQVAEHVGLFRDKRAEARAQEMHEADLAIKRQESERRAAESQAGAGVASNIMPVPCADSVDEWEQAAIQQQDRVLGR